MFSTDEVHGRWVWHDNCNCPGMVNNVASWDRIIRVVVGLVLVSLVFVGPQSPLGWVGLILVITGAVGFCPLYRMAGFSSCPAAVRK